MSEVPLELRLQRELDLAADGLYLDAERIGAALAEGARDSAQFNSQIAGLENVVNSSPRLTDVLDYVKRQTAKDTAGKTWLAPLEDSEVGLVLLDYLDGVIDERVRTAAGNVGLPWAVGKQPSAERLEAHLKLARLFVRQVAIHYRFAGVVR